MFAAGVVDLLVRMITSLAMVLGIVAIAYVVMRRRARTTTGTGRTARTGRTGMQARGGLRSPRTPRGGRRQHRASVEVVGRVGLSRSTAAVAVRFGDRVLLVGASEQAAPSVLAEVDAATWELCQAETEWAVPADIADVVGSPDIADATRPTFLDALREATVRRA
jgi:hypothetical protein